MAGDDGLRPEPLPDLAQQDFMQPAARDRNLRPAVTGGPAARLGPDQLAVLVVERKLLRKDAGLGQRVAQAERGQLAHRIRLQIDAVAERGERRHRIIDAASDADLVQAERQRQSGYAAADDDDLHSVKPQRGDKRRSPHITSA
jgi:hypothetical protein